MRLFAKLGAWPIAKAGWYAFIQAIAAMSLPIVVAAAQPPMLLPRFPSDGGKDIAFVAGGNLWSVPRMGGEARQLTDDPGQVLMPHFSPDGQRIAFTWRKGGACDVYVMPAEGGVPVRLTHGPSYGAYDNLVTGWTPDGASVLFLSERRTAFHRPETFRVSAGGGLAVPLGLGHAGLSSMSPDGGRIAYDWSFRNLGGDHWKRYVGGQAGEIFVYDLGTHEQHRITDWRGIDTAPMWSGDRLFFLSDRGAERRLNLWTTDTAGRSPRQITRFADFDIDLPSIGPGGIAFAEDGQLYRLDPVSERVEAVPIAFPAQARPKPREVPAAAFFRGTDIAHLPDFTLAPDGRTAYVVARGDVFAVHPDGGATNLTATPGATEDHPAIAPDGKAIAFVTDEDGTEQIAIASAGGGKIKTVTHLPSSALFQPRWSPDGRWLAVADGNRRLWLIAAATGAFTQIAASRFDEIHDAAFSPDGTLLAYSLALENGLRALHLRDLASGHDTLVDSAFSSDHDPVFTDDGRLVFVSARHERVFTSDRDREGTIASLASDGLYIAPLAVNGRLDLAGLASRAKPLAATTTGGFASPLIVGGTLFYRATAADTLGDDLPGQATALRALDLASGHDRQVADDVGAYVLTPDGRTALALRHGGLQYVSVADGAQQALSLKSLMIKIDPADDAREAFAQAWRLDRDLFWDPAMNGVDWPAIKARYAKWVPQIGSYEDLVYLIGELQGELSTSHMFIFGGDSGDIRPRERTALLGADLSFDAASGRYAFVRIYRGDMSRPRFTAPLADPALDVREGDLLLAIDGQALQADDDPYRLLLGKHGPLTLTICRDGAQRQVTVDPVDDEMEIRKLAWIDDNRHRVDQLSGGRAGYLYLSDFEALGAEDWLRQYYPQTGKAALVIDIRDNAGGFTSQWVLDLLHRRQAGLFRNRENGTTTLPAALAPSKLAVVTNLFSRSDGDQFPYFFREWKMGTVVGQRTWGGVRGLRGPWRLMSGLQITVPKDSLLSPDGRQVIENEGAMPDVVVDDSPADIAQGRDRQLEAAVQALERGH